MTPLLTSWQRAMAPLTASLLAGGVALWPRVAHAEGPADTRVSPDLPTPASQQVAPSLS